MGRLVLWVTMQKLFSYEVSLRIAWGQVIKVDRFFPGSQNLSLLRVEMGRHGTL